MDDQKAERGRGRAETEVNTASMDCPGLQPNPLSFDILRKKSLGSLCMVMYMTGKYPLLPNIPHAEEGGIISS